MTHFDKEPFVPEERTNRRPEIQIKLKIGYYTCICMSVRTCETVHTPFLFCLKNVLQYVNGHAGKIG